MGLYRLDFFQNILANTTADDDTHLNFHTTVSLQSQTFQLGSSKKSKEASRPYLVWQGCVCSASVCGVTVREREEEGGKDEKKGVIAH